MTVDSLERPSIHPSVRQIDGLTLISGSNGTGWNDVPTVGERSGNWGIEAANTRSYDLFSINSNFIGSFKLGDNINYNLDILALLYRIYQEGDERERGLLQHRNTVCLVEATG